MNFYYLQTVENKLFKKQANWLPMDLVKKHYFCGFAYPFKKIFTWSLDGIELS